MNCPRPPIYDPGTDGPGRRAAGPMVRVLVVDDDARVLRAIGETVGLEPDLQLVGQSGDAETALAMAEREHPSVALVDVLLPDVPTGLSLIRRLSDIPGCAVVAMSVRSAVRTAAMAAGAAYFVEKGDIDELLDTIRNAAQPDTRDDGQLTRPPPPRPRS